MANITIITDSASDISQNNNKGVTVLPMTITFGEENYEDGVSLTPDSFYMKLIESSALPKTSQVSPYAFGQAYENALKSADYVIVITLSSKLSGTYQSACIAADDYDGRVFVIDSENVTVGEQILIDYALSLIDKGIEVNTIVSQLNTMKKRIRLVALLDTLEYLKKGGRISSGAAFLGNVLSIKPVIAIVDGEVSFLGKARGSKQGNNFLIQQVDTYGGIDYSLPVLLGYTGCSTVLMDKYIKDSSSLWEGRIPVPDIIQVGATIGTHIGPGGIAVAFFSKE
jgi:DegV family protein with EDD domain|uniref:DegV family protein n=1 Tax=Lachnospira sp. TaxID=2049031 RepID=UPI003FED505E